MTFSGTVAIEERDDAAHRVVLRAAGMESQGKGAANATVTSWLLPAAGTTTVRMVADIQLTGAVAQLSRGLLPEVSRKLTQQLDGLPPAGHARRGGALGPGERIRTHRERSFRSHRASNRAREGDRSVASVSASRRSGRRS